MQSARRVYEERVLTVVGFADSGTAALLPVVTLGMFV